AVMSSTVENATEIRPFRVDLLRRSDRRPSAAHRRDALALQGARRRSVARRTAGDDPRAHPLLATEHDWRKCEAKLNALPQFKTEIDGVDIHFLHDSSR